MHARERFSALGGRIGEASAGLGLPLPAGGLTSLTQYAGLLPAMREATAARRKEAEDRRDAIDLLRQVEHLSCPADPSFSALASCHDLARSWRERIAAAQPGPPPVEAQTLLLGTHAFSSLLGLVSADDSTGDALWADWYDGVEREFGSSLAVAAARGRIAAAAF
jgi:hypothetical protein